MNCPRNRRNLSIENLEVRELMAADLRGSSSDLQATLAAPLTSSTTRTSAPSAPSVVIPVTTAGPRSFDGTGNNRRIFELGSTGEHLLRVSTADYSDGIWTPAGADRPSPREISNALAAQDEATAPNDRQLSAFVYVWGQFIDHDIDLTEPPTENREAFPIDVPEGDDYFDPDGVGGKTISLNRSRYDSSTGTSADNPRQQVNQITAWIDGSMIYGSDLATANSLRTFVGGKLRTSEGNLPPTDAAGNFQAGDTRANENIELTSMHTLFVREHNWWATQIARQNSRLSDEKIYQQARAIVIAELQAITYNEFLPAVLGKGAIASYRGYNPSVDPSIANEFSTAAFRMHSLINDDVEFFGNDGRAVRDEVALRDAFFNPSLLRETGADSILKYVASTTAQEVDLEIVESLRNFLFGQPGQGGFDLASLNIQRGRDHGLANYNSVRAAYGLDRVTSFAEISSDPNVQQTLEELYGSVDNIDLWVGGLAEDHVPGASVGELVHTIVADQFSRLRDGDRWWYQNIFTGGQLDQLQRTSLSDVISRNSTINNLQRNVFFLKSTISGQVFVDANANGRQDRRELAMAGVTVELIDDEGDVIASTLTNARGAYQFATFHETGDYRVRVVPPAQYNATTATIVDALISRGEQIISGKNFGLRILKPTASQTTQLAAVDAVFQSGESLLPLGMELDDTTLTSIRRARKA